LKLISDSVPGFDNLASLADRLLQAGFDIQSNERIIRTKGTEDFHEVQNLIRTELEQLCDQREPSKGLETLKQSLSLSNNFKSLCERIKSTENAGALNLLIKDANLELSIYAQRSKQLNKLISKRKEFIGVAGENLDDLISTIVDNETEEFQETTTSEVDF